MQAKRTEGPVGASASRIRELGVRSASPSDRESDMRLMAQCEPVVEPVPGNPDLSDHLATVFVERRHVGKEK
jgi:hypothetical protein